MQSRQKIILGWAAVCISLLFFILTAVAQELPERFVYVHDVIPDIVIDMRYTTPNNFVGHPIDGYHTSRCILTLKAAEALKRVQNDLSPFGLGLKVFDAYRPQRAVDHFVRWAKDLSDTKMKTTYYPNVDKKDLFKKKYIADSSSHSRGSTVDVTLVDMTSPYKKRELDMGSGFDFFGPISWPSSMSVGASSRAHRMLLQYLMMRHGFIPYAQEWWHFTLKDEPFPNTYFNFQVK